MGALQYVGRRNSTKMKKIFEEGFITQLGLLSLCTFRKTDDMDIVVSEVVFSILSLFQSDTGVSIEPSQ